MTRLLVYVREDVPAEEIKVGNLANDLRIITLLISLGKEKKTMVNFFYRKFTSGVSRMSNHGAQMERLERQKKLCMELSSQKNDMIIMQTYAQRGGMMRASRKQAWPRLSSPE